MSSSRRPRWSTLARNTRNTYRLRRRNTQSTSINTEGVRITAPIHDEYLRSAATEDNGSSISDLVSEVVGGRMAGRLSRNQRAAHAWFAANGDVERRHTCGVYLKKPGRAGGQPVLGVYVDSPSRVTDFRANKELYLARLANVGFAASDIDFRLSRDTRPSSQQARDRGRSTTRVEKPLPALTAAERREVSVAASGLPDGLATAVSRAMSLSLRREKQRKMESGT